MTPIAATAFAALLERETGQQLAAGRRWRIETALGPVMRAAGIDTLDRLATEVRRDHNPTLTATVVDALLNNETSFFRDAAVTAETHLAAFRALIEARAARGISRLRLWSAGCATGQEVFSFAMGLERLAPAIEGRDVALLGTDVSGAALARARRGVFSQMEVQRGLPIRELIAHFEAAGDDWRFRWETRARISFLRHNLLDPPPATGFDVVSCRNVLIYFAPERRSAVLHRLAQGLAEDGILMLGAGETLLDCPLFAPDPVHRGLYRRTPAPLPASPAIARR